MRMEGDLSIILLLSLGMFFVNNKAILQLLSDLRLGVMAGAIEQTKQRHSVKTSLKQASQMRTILNVYEQ